MIECVYRVCSGDDEVRQDKSIVLRECIYDGSKTIEIVLPRVTRSAIKQVSKTIIIVLLKQRAA